MTPPINASLRRAINASKRIYQRVVPATEGFGISYSGATLTGQAASDLIRQILSDARPAMIARFGYNELACVLNYCAIKEPRGRLKKTWSYIEGEALPFWWDQHIVDSMCNNAGFFPPSTLMLERFAELMLGDMKAVDVLGSWMKEEKSVSAYLPHATKVQLPDLEPYYHADPWTTALEGKRVLVVHPYASTIESQYAKRQSLFADARILPDFDLVTIRAVQSIANTSTGYLDWFAAFTAMTEQVSATAFDIAIVGCGAYGFPLAAHIKRMGRKAVHLGGATQVLFGIRGKRWDDIPYFRGLMNESWVRPTSEDVPKNHATVESGCYW